MTSQHSIVKVQNCLEVFCLIGDEFSLSYYLGQFSTVLATFLIESRVKLPYHQPEYKDIFRLLNKVDMSDGTGNKSALTAQ